MLTYRRGDFVSVVMGDWHIKAMVTFATAQLLVVQFSGVAPVSDRKGRGLLLLTPDPATEQFRHHSSGDAVTLAPA